MNYLTGAVLLTCVHRVIELLGPRLLLAGGTAIMAASAIGLSHVQAPWQLYLCSIVMAIGWAATTTTAIAMTLAYWFDRQARPCAQPGTDRRQRRRLHHRAVAGAAGAPHGPGTGRAAACSRRAGDPAADGAGRCRPGGLDRSHGAVAHAAHVATDPRTSFTSQAEALRSLHFWTVALPFALALAAQVGFIVHQVTFLLPRLGNDGTGIAIAATAIAAAVGRLAFAPMIDGMNQRVASAASFASQAAGLGLMLALPDRPEALYIGSVVFGLSVGNVITLPALIVQREFAPQSFGVVIGLSSMVGQATLAFGPTLLGLARDATGSYDAAIGLCIALQLVAAVLGAGPAAGSERMGIRRCHCERSEAIPIADTHCDHPARLGRSVASAGRPAHYDGTADRAGRPNAGPNSQ